MKETCAHKLLLLLTVIACRLTCSIIQSNDESQHHTASARIILHYFVTPMLLYKLNDKFFCLHCLIFDNKDEISTVFQRYQNTWNKHSSAASAQLFLFCFVNPFPVFSQRVSVYTLHIYMLQSVAITKWSGIASAELFSWINE